MKDHWRRMCFIVPVLLLLTSCAAGPPPRGARRALFSPGQAPGAHNQQKPIVIAKAVPDEGELSQAAILALTAALQDGAAEHADQAEFLALVQAGKPHVAFTEAFEHGDELFETHFNALDGVGANVGQGLRFTQMPRADLNGAGEWANHTPQRITGPNAEACNQCHGTPYDDGAGLAIHNNVRDPRHSGDAKQFIVRNAPHIFALGALQVLAEEMSEGLQAQQHAAEARACATGQAVTIDLAAKSIPFGALTAIPSGSSPCTTTIDTRAVQGIDADLVVRPFQWKGVIATVRAFNRDAAHQELGMQGVEIVGEGVDGDGDGVVNELTVGDQTALALYVAAQPRPTTQLELADLGLIEPLSDAERMAILGGEQRFVQSGCTHCHTPQLPIADPIFYEPSHNAAYRDEQFPAGQDPVALGVDPAYAVALDLTQDQPNNQIVIDGELVRLGSLPRNADGSATVALYGDLKRHDMGPTLAEMIDDEGIPPSVFLTENLWGVGSTAPYLHDGRATTLTEAILAHGGEAAASRNAFIGLSHSEQLELLAFLNNLVLYKYE